MIPLKLETLLKGRVVENDRVEYKRGWNPADTITTMCAYANDFNNTNGGYIVMGIEADETGRPLLPPVGINDNNLDNVQQELIQYSNFISPRYIPQIEIVQYQEKNVLYLWCSAGDSGPYSAPKDVLSENKHKEYWIKPASVKMIAKGEELSELFDKFNHIPYDDRVNRQAKLEDMRRIHLEDFLNDSNSALKDVIDKQSIADIFVALEVANYTDVGVDIRNIGLLMFSDHPEKFFPCAQIELIHFHTPDAEESDDFTEKIFTGPVQKQVRDALSYIKAILLVEKVIKHPDRAEATRFFNYPYAALEEILVNAVFHKSYRLQVPVEIRIYVDCIKVINHPGPEKAISMEQLRNGTAVSRRYRNRRIGEFLKEIDLSEKKSTGIKKILRALRDNGSPLPEFETDEERNYLIVTVKQHEGFAVDDIKSAQNNGRTLSDVEMVMLEPILKYINNNDTIDNKKTRELTGKSAATARRYLEILCNAGYLEPVGKKGTTFYKKRVIMSDE